MRPESTTSTRLLRGREREHQSLAMRRRGCTFVAIGAAIGVSESAASRAVNRALTRRIDADADTREVVRQLELERLDALTEAVWPAASAGDIPAVTAFLRIMDRRAKLLGLDVEARGAGCVGRPSLMAEPDEDPRRTLQIMLGLVAPSEGHTAPVVRPLPLGSDDDGDDAP